MSTKWSGRRVVLTLLLLGFVAALVAGCGQTSLIKRPGTAQARSPVAATAQPTQATCSELGSPTANPPAHWTPVPSLSPAQVWAGLEAAPDFINPTQVAYAPPDTSYSYGSPVLVLPATLGDPQAGGYYSLPHYILTASVTGVSTILVYDVTYNPATQQFSFNSVGRIPPGAVGYGKPFPWYGVSSCAAIQALRASKGLALAPSTVPELVFFSPGPQIWISKGVSNWAGGGTDPGQPIWRLHGGDGQLYFVGIDGNVYTPKQLPTLPGTTLITQE